MKLVMYNGEYIVIDSAKKIVKLTKKLEDPSDIFSASWLIQEDQTAKDAIELTEEAKSFKGLKHYAARYILSNKLPYRVPKRYVEAYKRFVEANRRTK